MDTEWHPLQAVLVKRRRPGSRCTSHGNEIMSGRVDRVHGRGLVPGGSGSVSHASGPAQSRGRPAARGADGRGMEWRGRERAGWRPVLAAASMRVRYHPAESGKVDLDHAPRRFPAGHSNQDWPENVLGGARHRPVQAWRTGVWLPARANHAREPLDFAVSAGRKMADPARKLLTATPHQRQGS